MKDATRRRMKGMFVPTYIGVVAAGAFNVDVVFTLGKIEFLKIMGWASVAALLALGVVFVVSETT